MTPQTCRRPSGNGLRVAGLLSGLALSATAALAQATNPWMETRNVIVIGGGEFASMNFAGYGVDAKWVDQLGQRPIHLLAPTNGVTTDELIGQLKARASNLKFLIFAVSRNAPVQSPENGDFGVVGAIKNSVNAIGEGQASSRGYALYWTNPWLDAPKLATATTGGLGITVAVLDNGVDYEHPTLKPKLLQGRDFVSNDTVASEVRGGALGHGTHVAGIVAQVAPKARILPVRVIDGNGFGTLWTVSKGLAFAVDPDGDPGTIGARVLNMSVGAKLTTDERASFGVVMQMSICHTALLNRTGIFNHGGFDPDRKRCLEAAGRQTVAVAGEGNRAGQTPLFPSNFGYAGLVAVTATDARGRRARWASSGAPNELHAPGELITSTYPGTPRIAVMSGTSMAAPWVSGVAALLLAGPAPAAGWTGPQVIARMRATAARVCEAPLGKVELAPTRAIANDLGSAISCR